MMYFHTANTCRSPCWFQWAIQGYSKHGYTKLGSRSFLPCKHSRIIKFRSGTYRTHNKELKIKFKSGYQEFWLKISIPTLYPGLWEIVPRFVIAFPTSYLAERGFSAVANLLSKNINWLHITDRGDLRLFLTKIAPDIIKLLRIHHAHPSH